MTQANVDYLTSIGIIGDLFTKTKNIFNFFENYLGQKIEDIFVSEYTNQDGGRVYENLWFFNENFCFEAKLFISGEDYDACIIKNNIEYYTIKKLDFDVFTNDANINSRMNIEFRFKNSVVGGALKASSGNCKKLSEIFKKYILINQVH
jgi:hypothetical protein